jgi:hypothetical protein
MADTMRTSIWNAAGLVAVMAAFVGCGGGGGKSPVTTPATATEFCQRIEARQLELFMQCYGGKAADWAIFRGESKCASLTQEVEKQRLIYDRTKAQACLATFAEAHACDDQWTDLACAADVLAGAVPDGQPCANGYVCQAGAFCAPAADAVGRCAFDVCRRQPKVGEPCSDISCESGSTCVGTGVCAANLKLGAACGGDGDPVCEYGLSCAKGDAAPTCKKIVEGGPCTSSTGCFDHQYCDTATKRCSARPALGGDCTADPASCDSFLACDPTTHRCVEASHVGQLCGNLIGVSFLCEATCVFGERVNHCVDPREGGAACAQDYECRSEHCIAGECSIPGSNDGAPCTDFTECTSATCNDGRCGFQYPKGAPCFGDGECMTGLLCLDGVCSDPVVDGQACTRNGQCGSGYCGGGVCAACPGS